MSQVNFLFRFIPTMHKIYLKLIYRDSHNKTKHLQISTNLSINNNSTYISRCYIHQWCHRIRKPKQLSIWKSEYLGKVVPFFSPTCHFVLFRNLVSISEDARTILDNWSCVLVQQCVRHNFLHEVRSQST